MAGAPSHAALIARQYGIPTVCGCGAVKIDESKREFTANGVTVKEGDIITIDGTLGLVYNVELDTEPATMTGDFGTFMAWADEYRKLGVRANADTPEHAADAIESRRRRHRPLPHGAYVPWRASAPRWWPT